MLDLSPENTPPPMIRGATMVVSPIDSLVVGCFRMFGQ